MSHSSPDEVAALTAKLASLVSTSTAASSASGNADGNGKEETRLKRIRVLRQEVQVSAPPPREETAGSDAGAAPTIAKAGGGGGTCPQCQKMFTSQSTLVAHFEEHTMFSTAELLELMLETASPAVDDEVDEVLVQGSGKAGFKIKDRTYSRGSDDDEEEELLMMLLHQGAAEDSPQSSRKRVGEEWTHSDVQALMAEIHEKNTNLAAKESEVHEKDCLAQEKEKQLASMEQLVVELNQRLYAEQQSSRSADERVARMGTELVEQRHAAGRRITL
jgi:hypothetical protein